MSLSAAKATSASPGRDVASQATAESLVDVFDIVTVRKNYNWQVWQLNPDTVERILYAGVCYASAPDIDDHQLRRGTRPSPNLDQLLAARSRDRHILGKRLGQHF